MISKKVIDAVIKHAERFNIEKVLSMFIVKLREDYFYNDKKVNNVLGLVLDPSTIIKEDDIDMEYVKNHLDNFIYDYERYIITDVKIKYIDNIEGEFVVEYNVKDKSSDKEPSSSSTRISFLDNEEVLKKS